MVSEGVIGSEIPVDGYRCERQGALQPPVPPDRLGKTRQMIRAELRKLNGRVVHDAFEIVEVPCGVKGVSVGQENGYPEQGEY
jgi:hypothetical protein